LRRKATAHVGLNIVKAKVDGSNNLLGFGLVLVITFSVVTPTKKPVV
jgi:hypothetical protein